MNLPASKHNVPPPEPEQGTEHRTDAGDFAVVANGLGKRFDIYNSDRGRIWEFFGNRQHHVEFWALRDVSFSIPRGQAFGVVGSNGAGKSTLLRLLSGISTPTEGKLEVRSGRPGLLDLDMAFHPDFTGRENIGLSCSIMGLPEERISIIYPRIVEFAELEDFIDFPVRTYSTGMQLRLGFAIAAHMNYDVIFIDEVLAVGDQYFQRKCIRKVEELLSEGKTLVLVSHDLHAIRGLCSEVMWLHAGRIVHRGPTAEVINAYVDVARDREGRIRARIFGGAESAHARAMGRRVAEEGSVSNSPEQAPTAVPERGMKNRPEAPWFSTTQDPELRGMLQRVLHFPDAETEWRTAEEIADYEDTHGERPIVTGTGEVRILTVRTLDGLGQEKAEFASGEALTVAVTFKTLAPVDRPILGVALFRNDDLYIFGPNTRFDKVKAMEGTYHGIYTYFLHYPNLPLLSGIYRFSVALYDKNHLKPHVWHNQLYEIKVTAAPEHHGIIDLPHHWGLIRHHSGDDVALP